MVLDDTEIRSKTCISKQKEDYNNSEFIIDETQIQIGSTEACL
jgi:hypothetical protein